MITPSDVQGYWNAIKAGNPVHVEMLFSKGTTLTEADIDISTGITITDLMNSDSDLVVGKSVCKQFTATIFLNDTIRNIDWKDRFRLRFGVEINGSTSWLTVGYFNGVRPRRAVGIDRMNYVAYDDMIKFEADAKDFIYNLSYPITGEDLMYAIGQEVGVSIPLSLMEPTFVIEQEFVESDLEDFDTYRQIIEAYAEATCTYAKVRGNGVCSFEWYGEEQSSIITIEQTDQFSVEHDDIYRYGFDWDDFEDVGQWGHLEYSGRRWGPMLGHYTATNAIDSVWIENKYGTDSSAGTGGTNQRQYWFIDNVFMKGGNSSSAAWYLNRLNGFGGQLPMTVECTGNWMLEAGDYVNVVVDDDEVIHMPIYNRTLRYNGAVTDVLETTGELFQKLR